MSPLPAPAACPKCAYVRKPSDTAPDWQCPACGIALHKFRAAELQVQAFQQTVRPATPLPPPLSTAERLVSSLPELLTALLFLFCWMAPRAWRPTLTMELGTVMLMEFFVMHSSFIFIALSSNEQAGLGSKLGALSAAAAFYLPVAGAFAWFNGGWWPLLAFAWLFLMRAVTVLQASGSGAFERKRQRFHWAAAVGFYVLAAFATMIPPMPRFGYLLGSVPWTGWNVAPQNVMAWGVCYFGAIALLRLLEKPEWVEEHDEANRT